MSDGNTRGIDRALIITPEVETYVGARFMEGVSINDLATHFACPAGVYAIALLSGMADVDAIALAMGRQGAAEIGLQAAGIAVLLAIASNTVVKTAMGWTLGGRALGGRLAIASTLAMIAGAAILWMSPKILS